VLTAFAVIRLIVGGGANLQRIAGKAQ
jgi:hypothetical protein